MRIACTILQKCSLCFTIFQYQKIILNQWKVKDELANSHSTKRGKGPLELDQWRSRAACSCQWTVLPFWAMPTHGNLWPAQWFLGADKKSRVRKRQNLLPLGCSTKAHDYTSSTALIKLPVALKGNHCCSCREA